MKNSNNRRAGLSAFLIASSMPVWLAAAPSVPGDTIIILDASASMKERIGGESKMSIAHRAVTELIDGLPDETRIGLVAYSHRRNACDDIELLIPPGPLDKVAFVKAVVSLKPVGRTPLIAAIEFTTEVLNSSIQKANIVLVSDGVETCGGEPCSAAQRIAELCPELTIHTVAFDLGSVEARSLECIATATQGRFLEASDNHSLTDALRVVVTAATATEKADPPVERLTPAMLKLPNKVLLGAKITVEWTGPENPGDFLTVVPQGTPDSVIHDKAYIHEGNPLTLRALTAAGGAEVRYVAARSGKILGRAEITIVDVEVTLSAAGEVVEGGEAEVIWTGPNNANDFLTIMPKAAPDGGWQRSVFARTGSPLKLTAPMVPGEAEIRYHAGNGGKVLGRRPIRVLSATITLDAPSEAIAGSVVSIIWTGPNNLGDFLTIVPKSWPDGSWSRTVLSRVGSPLTLFGPGTPGDAEIRYHAGNGGRVLARRDLLVIAAEITLSAPARAQAGSLVEVEWTGPNNRGDYIAIVAKSAPDHIHDRFALTRIGSPVTISMPQIPGPAEIRYLDGYDNRVLDRIDILITKP